MHWTAGGQGRSSTILRDRGSSGLPDLPPLESLEAAGGGGVAGIWEMGNTEHGRLERIKHFLTGRAQFTKF